MATSAVEEDNKTLDAQTYHQIDIIVQDLYKICVADRGDAKMGNASVLQLLNEIEKNIDKYTQDFIVSEEIAPHIVQEQEKEIKKACRTENREKAQKREQAENEAKQKKRQDA
jgi:hypothetical protein